MMTLIIPTTGLTFFVFLVMSLQLMDTIVATIHVLHRMYCNDFV